MIARYTRPGMGAIWTDENKYRMWLKVETAASETLAEDGIVPREAAAAIRDKGDFDLKRIYDIEAEVKHDVIAFTTAVAEKIGPAGALAALRPHLERCGGHGAGAAGEGRLRIAAPRHSRA